MRRSNEVRGQWERMKADFGKMRVEWQRTKEKSSDTGGNTSTGKGNGQEQTWQPSSKGKRNQ